MVTLIMESQWCLTSVYKVDISSPPEEKWT